MTFYDCFRKHFRKHRSGQSPACRDASKSGNILPFQVKEFTSRSGDEIVLLLDRQDGPAFWPNVFVTSRYAVAGRAADPSRLPPIKAGNPASALIQAASVPKTTLRRAQRQAASTGIPDVAEAIREGSFPDLPTFDLSAAGRHGVYLWNCPESDVPRFVIQAFEALVGAPAQSKQPGFISRLHQMDVQILAMTRRGPTGAADLGDAIESHWMASQQAVADWGFSVGSKFFWTQNSYDSPTGKVDSKGTEITVDIMNGALGVIGNVIDKHALARFDDGAETMLPRNDLARVLRGWAITVHKAQGSAFKTVLIPVVRSRLLDRAMLSTAVTRARLTAVLIGEDALMRRVVGAPPRAWQRLQALDIDRAAGRAGLAHHEPNGSVHPKVAIRGKDHGLR